MTRLLICAADSREALRWARSRRLEPGSYRTTIGQRAEHGLRGYSDVVYVVLPGYWRSVPRGDALYVSQVLDHRVAREPDPITRTVGDGDERVFVAGARAKVEPLLCVLEAGGHRAPARG